MQQLVTVILRKDFFCESTFRHLVNLCFKLCNCIVYLFMVRLELSKCDHRLFFFYTEKLLHVLIRLFKPRKHVCFLLPCLLEIREIKVNPFLHNLTCSDLEHLHFKFAFAIFLFKADLCDLIEDIVR